MYDRIKPKDGKILLWECTNIIRNTGDWHRAGAAVSTDECLCHICFYVLLDLARFIHRSPHPGVDKCTHIPNTAIIQKNNTDIYVCMSHSLTG